MTLSTAQVAEILKAMAGDLIAAKDGLNELDSAAGDGDLGISMSRGFDAVRKGLAEPGDDIGKLLIAAGMQFNEAAGSTIGALLSTALMRAGREVRGVDQIGLAEVMRMSAAAEQGIRDRGKAEPGNKTMLDALVPANAALVQAQAEGLDLPEALSRSLEAAEQGMLATKEMVPTFGRARWLPERARGHQDPGATAVYLMLKSLVEHVDKV
jgi:dihydroxyacetone kinase-like protein